MMRKLLLRSMALSLAFCLAVDPVTAQVFHTDLPFQPLSSTSVSIQRFSSEALTLRVIDIQTHTEMTPRATYRTFRQVQVKLWGWGRQILNTRLWIQSNLAAIAARWNSAVASVKNVFSEKAPVPAPVEAPPEVPLPSIVRQIAQDSVSVQDISQDNEPVTLLRLTLAGEPTPVEGPAPKRKRSRQPKLRITEPRLKDFRKMWREIRFATYPSPEAAYAAQTRLIEMLEPYKKAAGEKKMNPWRLFISGVEKPYDAVVVAVYDPKHPESKFTLTPHKKTRASKRVAIQAQPILSDHGIQLALQSNVHIRFETTPGVTAQLPETAFQAVSKPIPESKRAVRRATMHLDRRQPARTAPSQNELKNIQQQWQRTATVTYPSKQAAREAREKVLVDIRPHLQGRSTDAWRKLYRVAQKVSLHVDAPIPVHRAKKEIPVEVANVPVIQTEEVVVPVENIYLKNIERIRIAQRTIPKPEMGETSELPLSVEQNTEKETILQNQYLLDQDGIEWRAFRLQSMALNGNVQAAELLTVLDLQRATGTGQIIPRSIEAVTPVEQHPSSLHVLMDTTKRLYASLPLIHWKKHQREAAQAAEAKIREAKLSKIDLYLYWLQIESRSHPGFFPITYEEYESVKSASDRVAMPDKLSESYGMESAARQEIISRLNELYKALDAMSDEQKPRNVKIPGDTNGHALAALIDGDVPELELPRTYRNIHAGYIRRAIDQELNRLKSTPAFYSDSFDIYNARFDYVMSVVYAYFNNAEAMAIKAQLDGMLLVMINLAGTEPTPVRERVVKNSPVEVSLITKLNKGGQAKPLSDPKAPISLESKRSAKELIEGFNNLAARMKADSPKSLEIFADDEREFNAYYEDPGFTRSDDKLLAAYGLAREAQNAYWDSLKIDGKQMGQGKQKSWMIEAADLLRQIRTSSPNDILKWEAQLEKLIRRAGNGDHLISNRLRDALLQKQPLSSDSMVAGAVADIRVAIHVVALNNEINAADATPEQVAAWRQEWLADFKRVESFLPVWPNISDQVRSELFAMDTQLKQLETSQALIPSIPVHQTTANSQTASTVGALAGAIVTKGAVPVKAAAKHARTVTKHIEPVAKVVTKHVPGMAEKLHAHLAALSTPQQALVLISALIIGGGLFWVLYRLGTLRWIGKRMLLIDLRPDAPLYVHASHDWTDKSLSLKETMASIDTLPREPSPASTTFRATHLSVALMLVPHVLPIVFAVSVVGLLVWTIRRALSHPALVQQRLGVDA